MEKRKLDVYNGLRNESRNNGRKALFVSYSKLEKFLKCRLAYKLQYIDKEKVTYESNIHSEIGTLCHDIIEKTIAENLSREQYVEEFLTKSKAITDKFSLDHYIPLIKSLRHFFENSDFKERYTKAEFEVPVTYKLRYDKEDTDVYIVGFIDCVLHREDGSVDIIDFKTSNKSSYSGKKLQQALVQPFTYAYIYEYMTRKKINQVGYHFLKYVDMTFVDTKGKNRKSSKVERKDIDTDFKNKNGEGNLVLKDSFSFFEYNNETRLSYMKQLVDLFKEVDSLSIEAFTCKDRDVSFCDRFCPFKDHPKCNKHEVDREEPFLMKDALSIMFSASDNALGMDLSALDDYWKERGVK